MTNGCVGPLTAKDAAAAAELISAACPWHPASERRLQRKLFAHEGFSPDLALAMRGPAGRLDAVAAVAICPPEDSALRAEWVALATRPERHRQGLAGTLYAEIEANLRRRAVREILVKGGILSSGLDLRYAPAATMLIRRQYRPTEVVYDMALDPEHPADVPAMPAGFQIRELAEGDRQALGELCAAEFPDWGYAQGLIRPDEPCGVIGVFDHAGCLVAFAGWNEYIFGPTGTVPAYRGRGLGRAVFWRAVTAMRAAGFGEHICISVANVAYYARAFRCHVSATAWHMGKDLAARA